MIGRILFAVLVAIVPLALLAQEPVLPVPPNVRLEGVPPIPMSLVNAVSPYADFRQARFLAWHPDERRMLIATSFANVPQIHQVRGPGGARAQLTFFPDGARGQAAYDRSGRAIVFQKDTGAGTQALQLFRYDFSTGATTLLTDGRSVNGVPVLANGRNLIAYESSRRNGKDRDIFVMDPADPKTDRLVAELQGLWYVLDWSPDDRELLILEAPSGFESYLWRLDVESGKRVAITPRDGAHVAWTDARFGPDGKQIYATGNYRSEYSRLLRLDAGARDWVPISGEAEHIDRAEMSPDGKLIAVVVDTGARSELRLLDARTGKARPVPSLPPGVISNLAWHPKGGEVAFTFAGGRTFNDVYSLEIARGRVDRWTASEIGGANPESIPDAEVVRWKSFDGLEISGVMYRAAPRFTGPRPVIINVHGGPALRERPRALGRSNYFRNEMGVTIIYPNIRGSAGFGRAFEQADNGAQREDAVKDIGALLDWIATQPHLDKTRVMITGSSYGGYVTYASAIAFPGRIRCAFAGFGISDFITYLESTEVSRRVDRRAEYGDPSDPKMRELLSRISPLNNASRLRVPLLIAQGGRDTAVPLGQAEAMANAIKANGTPLWYVVYEDAGHEELTVPTNNFNIYTWVLFARTYLLQ